MVADISFFKDKKVLVTGHTGFKGSWLSILLNYLGANVYGIALDPPTEPSLFKLAELEGKVNSNILDIQNGRELTNIIDIIRPEIIIHMAAQALVIESYRDPLQTYETNVIGVVNLFEAVRKVPDIKAVLNVTTDKCYENKEWQWSYRENEPLGGYDPYSSSKACSELVTSSYRNSYFNPDTFSEHGVVVASARAGNVIGGGDFAENRLIPDFIKAISSGKTVNIRSPHAIRPWQHVLEPLSGYLNLVQKMYINGPEFASAWNFGPNESDAKTVEWIVENLCRTWANGADYKIEADQLALHEANYLKLDCSKAKALLGWQPKWNIEQTIVSIVKWSKAYLSEENIKDVTLNQIKDYLNN